MKSFNSTTYPIIGMSPGNSYFKDEEVQYLLKKVVEQFGRVGILVADVPAISTYIALGYPENRARRDKAIPKGNALKNRVLKAMSKLGYPSDVVKIFNWEKEIENNTIYKQNYNKLLSLYNENDKFKNSINSTTRGVIEGSKYQIQDIEKAISIAVHYLISELSFMDFLPRYIGVEKVVYVYHKNWKVYEDYIAGKFDNIPKKHMEFLLIENPYETYNKVWESEPEEKEYVDFIYKDVLDRIEQTKTIHVGFAYYSPALMHDSEYNKFSGIFCEIITEIAKKYGWQIRWTEEVGYGVIIDGLDQDRFDLFGSTVWPTPERKSEANFSDFVYKSKVFTFIRSDNKKTWEQINKNLNSRVAIKENDITDHISKTDFPNHRKVRVPQLSDATEVLKFVAEDNADFTFVEPYLAEYFNNISTVKLVKISENPIRVYDNAFIFKKGERRLKNLIDKELEIMKENGYIKSLILKYTGSEDTFTTSL